MLTCQLWTIRRPLFPTPRMLEHLSALLCGFGATSPRVWGVSPLILCYLWDKWDVYATPKLREREIRQGAQG